ncbi:unnamed protein product, partial [Mesorhabditis spiculigera]
MSPSTLATKDIDQKAFGAVKLSADVPNYLLNVADLYDPVEGFGTLSVVVDIEKPSTLLVELCSLFTPETKEVVNIDWLDGPHKLADLGNYTLLYSEKAQQIVRGEPINFNLYNLTTWTSMLPAMFLRVSPMVKALDSKHFLLPVPYDFYREEHLMFKVPVTPTVDVLFEFVDIKNGKLTAEFLDENGKVLEKDSYSKDGSESGDSRVVKNVTRITLGYSDDDWEDSGFFAKIHFTQRDVEATTEDKRNRFEVPKLTERIKAGRGSFVQTRIEKSLLRMPNVRMVSGQTVLLAGLVESPSYGSYRHSADIPSITAYLLKFGM